MKEEIKEKYFQAGKIASRAIERAEKLIKPNAKVLKICENLEQFILREGGTNAFPVNVSINEVAAHYTATVNDTSVLPEKGLLTIDLGAHIDGYIVDTAKTFSITGEGHKLITVADEALEKVITSINPNDKISKIGDIVEDFVTSQGFKPIKNLSGHNISRYSLHSGISIPNYRGSPSKKRLVPGVYAIEPFVTTGNGFIKNDQQATIFRFNSRSKRTIDKYKGLLEKLQTFNDLPFTPRWIPEHYEQFEEGLLLLVDKRMIDAYPVLIEETNSWVSQAEHTLLVEENNIEVLTAK